MKGNSVLWLVTFMNCMEQKQGGSHKLCKETLINDDK
jgi:hypothetical protein